MFNDRSYFSVPVVGVTLDDCQYTISHLRVGEKLVLVREPDILYDPNAIAEGKRLMESRRVISLAPWRSI